MIPYRSHVLLPIPMFFRVFPGAATCSHFFPFVPRVSTYSHFFLGPAACSQFSLMFPPIPTQDQLADALTKSGYSSILYNSLNNAVLP